MGKQKFEPLDMTVVEIAHLPGAMQGDAGMQLRRRRQHARHAMARVAEAAMPVVIEKPILLRLADERGILHKPLLGMGDNILHGGILLHHAAEIFAKETRLVDAARLVVDVMEQRILR